MDNTLKTLHLRLDTTSKSLTKSAISQIIVKILFFSEKSLSINEIANKIEIVFLTKIAENRVIDSLNQLLTERLVRIDKKRYYLSGSKKRTIQEAYLSSQERLNKIIDKFFSPLNTDKEFIKTWLSEVTMVFFKEFSTEWISDICHRNSKHIEKQKTDIFNVLLTETFKYRKHLKDEPAELCRMFSNFINTKDVDVDTYLWEYGTASFASTLINSSMGIDEMSVQAFQGSKCILDTNVLMDIGLETSVYNKAFKELDKVFSKLDIQLGYFYITKKEYRKTVGIKRDEILRSVEKFSFEVIKATEDDYIQTALKRRCRNLQDFEVFFNEIITVPEYLDENHSIQLFDSDIKLERAISNSMEDEKKLTELNNIYKEITKRDKREAPLKHDVGLVAGCEYLRDNEKCFIISQEISINQYARKKPSKFDLPFALRVETIINMLAIDNGGTDINPNDYSNLFANIVRHNLIPDKDTFRVTDLSRLLDAELQIAQLPKEEIIEIAKDVHRNRAIGLDDEKISLELIRKFQGAKLRIAGDLEEFKGKYHIAERDKVKHKTTADTFREALRDKLYLEELEDWERKSLVNKLICYLAIPIGTLLLTFLLIFLLRYNSEESSLSSYLFGLLGNLAFWLTTSFVYTKPNLSRNKTIRENQINQRVKERISNIENSKI